MWVYGCRRMGIVATMQWSILVVTILHHVISNAHNVAAVTLTLTGPHRITNGASATYLLRLTDTDGVPFPLFRWDVILREPTDAPPNNDGIVVYSHVESVLGKTLVDMEFQLHCHDGILVGDVRSSGMGAGQLYGKVASSEAYYFVSNTIDVKCSSNPSSTGDPHFKTWSGHKYDFHGACDMVLLDHPQFNHGAGMRIHIRTRHFMSLSSYPIMTESAQSSSSWSYIERVVIQIGNETIEMAGDDINHHTIVNSGVMVTNIGMNKIGNNTLFWRPGHDQDIRTDIPESFAGYPVTYSQIQNEHGTSWKLTIYLTRRREKIMFKAFKYLIDVSIVGGQDKHFEGSLGLLGSYETGQMVARDDITVLDHDPDAFGQEWQVLPGDEHYLFAFSRGDEADHGHCIKSSKLQSDRDALAIQRRLRGRASLLEENVHDHHQDIKVQDAELACASVVMDPDDHNLCVFDILATQDWDLVHSYEY